MIQAIRKYSLIPALLLSIFFFAGISCSSIALANQVESDQCCDKESAPEIPADSAECLDCSCPSCVVVPLISDSQDDALTVTAMSLSWFFSDNLPPGFIRSIDYPPEVL